MMETGKKTESFVYRGPEPIVPVSNRALGHEIYKRFTEFPEKFILMINAHTGEKLYLDKFAQSCVNLAAALRWYGYHGQQTVISISAENSLDFFVPVLASLLNGSVLAPLNHLYTPYELEHCLKLTKPTVVFCSEKTAAKFVQLKNKFDFIQRIVVFSTHAAIEHAQSMEEFVQEALGEDDANVNKFEPTEGNAGEMAAFILNSSGTTGLPKGVVLTHQNINVKISHSRDPRFHLQNATTSLGIMPFFHGYGLLRTFYSIINQETVICMDRFDEDVFLRSIERYKIAVVPLAPPLAIFLAKSPKVFNHDLSSIRDLICGAAPLSKDVEEEVKKRLNVPILRQAYGLTESTLALTTMKLKEYRPGSSGKVQTWTEGIVRDPATGEFMGPNRVGELCWKGPMIMQGYYNDPQATVNCFTSDGWFKSGDLGYYDEDGFLFVVDRLKELIKYKGYQVAPAELEAILINHPKVNEAGVVGLPDELVGERPVAFVSLKNDTSISEEELIKYVAQLVSPQKRLSGGIIFINSIPKNPSGKILRRELRDLAKKTIKVKIHNKL